MVDNAIICSESRHATDSVAQALLVKLCYIQTSFFKNYFQLLVINDQTRKLVSNISPFHYADYNVKPFFVKGRMGNRSMIVIIEKFNKKTKIINKNKTKTMGT